MNKKEPASKAGFVRSQPATASVDQVVENARSAGIQLTRDYVYKVRGGMKKHKKPAQGPSRAAKKAGPSSPQPEKKVPGIGAPPRMADLIRSLPTSMPAREVVVEIAKKGLNVSPEYVSRVRRETRNRGSKAPQPRPVGTAGANIEATFRKSVLDLGLEKSRRLLAEVEQKLKDLISGR